MAGFTMYVIMNILFLRSQYPDGSQNMPADQHNEFR